MSRINFSTLEVSQHSDNAGHLCSSLHIQRIEISEGEFMQMG